MNQASPSASQTSSCHQIRAEFPSRLTSFTLPFALTATPIRNQGQQRTFPAEAVKAGVFSPHRAQISSAPIPGEALRLISTTALVDFHLPFRFIARRSLGATWRAAEASSPHRRKVSLWMGLLWSNIYKTPGVNVVRSTELSCQ